MEEAKKYDSNKIRMELLDPIVLEKIAEGFTFGAKKYGDFNYLMGRGLDTKRVYGALLRHLNAWYSGETIDKESELSHLAHAGCCISMLISLVNNSQIHIKHDGKQ